MTPEDYARRAYEAYGATTGGLNYQGLPMPEFDDLGETIQCAWTAAAMVVLASRPKPREFVVSLSPTTTARLLEGVRREIARQLVSIRTELGIVITDEEHIMDQQIEVDADVAAIEEVVADIPAALANIEKQLADAQAANPAVDLSGLAKAVADLKGAQAGVDAVETPAPVVPPVDDVPPVDGTPADDGTAAPVDDAEAQA